MQGQVESVSRTVAGRMGQTDRFVGAGRLALCYAGCAALAGAANLAAQAIWHLLWHDPTAGGAAASMGAAYWTALAIGTAVGLVVKYLLDKRLIFDDRRRGAAIHGRLFTLYTVMGIATTAVFWGVQTAAFVIFRSESALYLGGALGLGIGYTMKYHLDRRFVFARGAR